LLLRDINRAEASFNLAVFVYRSAPTTSSVSVTAQRRVVG